MTGTKSCGLMSKSLRCLDVRGEHEKVAEACRSLWPDAVLQKDRTPGVPERWWLGLGSSITRSKRL